MTHIIDLQELIKFQQEEKVLFASASSSKNESKRLYCTLRGNYEVWYNGEKITECMQPFSAVEKYNSINL